MHGVPSVRSPTRSRRSRRRSHVEMAKAGYGAVAEFHLRAPRPRPAHCTVSRRWRRRILAAALYRAASCSRCCLSITRGGSTASRRRLRSGFVMSTDDSRRSANPLPVRRARSQRCWRATHSLYVTPMSSGACSPLRCRAPVHPRRRGTDARSSSASRGQDAARSMARVEHQGRGRALVPRARRRHGRARGPCRSSGERRRQRARRRRPEADLGGRSRAS